MGGKSTWGYQSGERKFQILLPYHYNDPFQFNLKSIDKISKLYTIEVEIKRAYTW